MGTVVVPELPDAGYPIPEYIAKEFGIENRQLVVGAMHHGPNECHACGASIHRVHSWLWDGERLTSVE